MNTFRFTTLITIYFAMVACVLSCKKPETVNKEEEKSSEKHTFLSFESVYEYETCLEDDAKINAKFTQEDDYVSMYDYYQTTNPDAMPTDEKTLAEVLNPEGMVKVGPWIIKLKFDDKTVLVLDEKDSAYTQQLANGEIVPGVTKVFSFEDEVLELLAAGLSTSPTPDQRTSILCSGGISAIDVGGGWQVFDNTTFTINLEYNNFGVYFSQNYVFTVPKSHEGRIIKYSYLFSGNRFAKTVCSRPNYYEGNITTSIPSDFRKWTHSSIPAHKINCYEGTRKLACAKWYWGKCDVFFINTTTKVGTVRARDYGHGCPL